MQYKSKKGFYMYIRNGGLFLLGMILSACIYESTDSQPQNTYISIRVDQADPNQTRAEIGVQPGDFQDRIVQSLRVMAFDRPGGAVASNIRHPVLSTEFDVIRHLILAGDYDFVFIANEPNGSELYLENIAHKNDLYELAFPETAFTAENPIPMLQSIENVTITIDEKMQLHNGTQNIHGRPGNYMPGEISDVLRLELDRLAARVEITLNSQTNLNEVFTGITLSNIPDRVPLFASAYTGVPIQRNGLRVYDSGQFLDTGEAPWSKKISRIILPSNNLLANPADKLSAVVMTVNITDLYNPSCELRVETDNYSLPYNSWLDVIGNVREPLELSIIASDWGELLENEWEILPARMLNISTLQVELTDYERVRVYFWCNTDQISVLPDVYVDADDDFMLPTNQVFNDLAATVDTPNPGRFYHDPITGQGYMDLVINSASPSGTTVYKLFLAAENDDSENQLIREINITVHRTGVISGN